MQLKTAKLPSKDAQGVIQYLRYNQFLLTTELAEEKVYEVNSLFLDAFDGESMFTCSSGVINAPVDFKISSYITNLVLLNQQRISYLENMFTSVFKSVLNGYMRTLEETLYPQDFTK